MSEDQHARKEAARYLYDTCEEYAHLAQIVNEIDDRELLFELTEHMREMEDVYMRGELNHG